MNQYSISEIKRALSEEKVGESQSRYVIETLVVNRVSEMLDGKIVEGSEEAKQVAKLYVMGHYTLWNMRSIVKTQEPEKFFDQIEEMKNQFYSKGYSNGY